VNTTKAGIDLSLALNNSRLSIDDLRRKEIENAGDLKKLSQEFEAIFLKHLLAEMEKTVPKSELLSSNWVNSHYQDMLFQSLAEKISQNGSIGIGKMLLKNLKLNQETANKIS